MTFKKWIVLSSVLMLVAAPAWAQQLRSARAPEFLWTRSLPIDPDDTRIGPIGGTEVRALLPFDNKLFAAIGYWQDTEKDNPALPGAQVLRLDGTGSEWRIDLQLDDRNARGLRLYQAISTLETVHIASDRSGQPLPSPVDLLLAAVWKRGEGVDVFSRVDGSGFRLWSKSSLPGGDRLPRGTQIRAFALHHDAVTGADIVFAGATHAIVTGTYDSSRQTMVWDPQTEWQGGSTGDVISAKGRVSSFADCNGKLYATAYDTIYERADGPAPKWRSVFHTVIHAQSNRVTGLRGLTCIHGSSGSNDVLLASVEDNPSRVYRIDPIHKFDSVLELNVSSFLTKVLNTQATYSIVAYNNMTPYPSPDVSCPRYLLSLGAVTPEAADTFYSHDANAYFLVRDCDGTYALHEVSDPSIKPKPQLVSVRALAVSPFPSDPPGTVYAGGFDTARHPVHNTAWLYKGVPTAVSGANQN